MAYAAAVLSPNMDDACSIHTFAYFRRHGLRCRCDVTQHGRRECCAADLCVNAAVSGALPTAACIVYSACLVYRCMCCLLLPRCPLLRSKPVSHTQTHQILTHSYFSGFLVRFDALPVWWKWYSYLNPLRYAWTARESHMSC